MEAIALGGADPRPIDRLLGLVLHARALAAETYGQWAELRPEHRVVLRHFAQRVERGSHGLAEPFTRGGAFPDRGLYDSVLGALAAELADHAGRGEADALAVAQIFVVEPLVLATLGALKSFEASFPGAREAFAQCVQEGNARIEWTVRFLRLRFFEREKDLAGLVERRRTPQQAASLQEVASALEALGLSGADWSAALRDEQWLLTERLELPAEAQGNVMQLAR